MAAVPDLEGGMTLTPHVPSGVALAFSPGALYGAPSANRCLTPPEGLMQNSCAYGASSLID